VIPYENSLFFTRALRQKCKLQNGKKVKCVKKRYRELRQRKRERVRESEREIGERGNCHS